ncbi:hypothetical protein AGOR_G00058460 [Albula goreensis]|uniref:Dystrotelin n=1 Tax=Albula goreensis TaxID=1534307 RepID=A0A8T3DNV3_9TELE|nr:hypothetical protein AGOR_G00058460 [Albula goreensis]
MGQSLEQLFQGVSEEMPGQVPPGAAEQTCRLLFKLFDRGQTGFVSLRSVEAALIALSGDTLSEKHAALFRLAERCSGRQGRESGTVSRSGLRAVLDDLSQVPAVVQESQVFGPVENAVRTCFQGVLSAGVSEEAFLRWLCSEPRLLLWLSTLYRISVSQAVTHRVRCRLCKTFPITGLRYRCLKCLNLHLCQTCFLTQKRNRRHKPSHPVMEHCTQPSFRESMMSLAHSVRHNLLRRHFARREAERRSALCTETPARILHCDPTPSQLPETTPPQTQATPPQPAPESKATPPHRSSEIKATPTEPKLESKAMQTDSALEPQVTLTSRPVASGVLTPAPLQPAGEINHKLFFSPALKKKTSVLTKEPDLSHTQMVVRDLQRDKWQLEKQLQVWRAAVRSEHSSLENKCCHLEATVEVLTRHNHNLQEELGRVRLLLPDQEGTAAKPGTTASASQSEAPLEGAQIPSACEATTLGQHPLVAPEPQSREEPTHSSHQEAEPHQDTGARLEEEHVEKRPLNQSQSFLEEEKQLCDLVLRLKSALTVQRRSGLQPAQSKDLLAAAEAVGDSISQLVCAAGSLSPSPEPCPITPRQPHSPLLSANHTLPHSASHTVTVHSSLLNMAAATAVWLHRRM